MKNIRKILSFLFLFLSICTHAQKSALQWATYFGGDSAVTGGYSQLFIQSGYFGTAGGSVTDTSGNTYLAGYTFSLSGIATQGAYQTLGDSVYGNAFLAKFNSAGKLLWATYFGGKGYDDADGPVVDRFGNVYISGTTSSTSGIATSGAYQTSGDSAWDATYLAKFSPSGNLLWATYFGDSDKMSDIAIDTSGSVFISGFTSSTYGIATKGAYQTKGETNPSAFLAKFNSGGSLLWSTYYGGNGGAYSNAITTDISGNVYMTGGTSSDSGIATSGAYQTTRDNRSDIFLTKFSPSGSLLWGTYYEGDEGDGVATDLHGNVYITGLAYSTSGIATSGAYQATGDSVKGSAFLVKFSSSGGLLWGTYYGGNGGAVNGITWGYGIITDAYDNVYISGYTGSMTGIATAGAFLTSNTGGFDTYLAKFSASGCLLWASYFGGNRGAYGASLGIDKSDNIYISGETYSTSSIATSGAYQTSGNEAQGDAFLAKFLIPTFYNDAGISAILSPGRSVCADSIPVEVRLKNYGPDTLKAVKIICSMNNEIKFNYTWAGNLLSGNSTSVSLGNYSFKPGIDTIKAWTEPIGFTDTVPGNDTATLINTINALPNASFTYKLTRDTFLFIPVNTTYQGYSWSFGDGNISDSISPSHTYANNGTYTVSLKVTDKNGCMSSYKTMDTINYTGIAKIDNQISELRISPNPFTNKTIITYSLQNNANLIASIYDITGRLIIVLCNGTQVAGNHSMEFDADKYNSGIYILKMQINNELITSKIVKIN